MVITLDKYKKPLAHCTEKRARILLERGRAVVYRCFPFTIIVKDVDSREIQNTKDKQQTKDEQPKSKYCIKIDPGSIHTGITVVCEDKVILYIQIIHRGGLVVEALKTCYNARHNRRSRETWYRHPKFPARGGHEKYKTSRPKGWLPPSQKSIADNVINWVRRLERYLGPCEVDIEGVKFDMQLMDNPDIEGVEYQRGTLYGYEIRHYLMEKYQHTCQYCAGESGDPVLEWEHMVPKSRGGTDTVKNATVACSKCNQTKGNMTPQEWLDKLKTKKHPSDLDKKRIECLERVVDGKKNGQNLRYAAWVNCTRDYLYWGLMELPQTISVHRYTGGRTSYNRTQHNIEKDHHLDAMCVGVMPENGYRGMNQKVLYVTAKGRGTRLLGQINKCGVIIVKYHDHHKRVNGLQTGDVVRVHTPNGKYAGTHVGRVMVRASGSHDIKRMDGKLVTGTRKSQYKILQHMDGYEYSYQTKDKRQKRANSSR